MSLFDLLFILLFLIAVSVLMVAAWFAISRQFGRSRKILFKLVVGAMAYMAVVIAVSLILPRRVVKVGDLQCFDDWCVSIGGFKREPQGVFVAYSVDLRL